MVILLNVLISLFATAYSEVNTAVHLFGSHYLSLCMAQVIGDAEAEYMAFFAWKTVAMIRAPDAYVYPAPFNLVELFFIAPLE